MRRERIGAANSERKARRIGAANSRAKQKEIKKNIDYTTIYAYKAHPLPAERRRILADSEDADVAQSVEHLICNQGVGGSIPSISS